MRRLVLFAAVLLGAACAGPGASGRGRLLSTGPRAGAVAAGTANGAAAANRVAANGTVPGQAVCPQIPWVHHPPWDPDDDDTGPPLAEALSLKPLPLEAVQGTAALFVQLARRSKATYVIEPGPDLPPGSADAFLGAPARWPDGARPFAEVILAGDTPMVVDRQPGPEADGDMVAAELATRDHAFAAALRLYRAVTRADPGLAKAWTFRAEDAAALGHLAEARRAVARALSLSPVDPMAHAVDAELDLAAGKRARARRALATALALYPRFPPAVALVAPVTGAPLSWHALSPPVHLARTGRRRILVQADVRRTSAWLVWGLCQAISRFDPDPRLSPVGHGGTGLRRAVVCAMALADAATDPQVAAGTGAADPRVTRIARIARAGDLGDLVLYDLLAARTPGLLLGLSPSTRQGLVAYVSRFVLPGARPPARVTAKAR